MKKTRSRKSRDTVPLTTISLEGGLNLRAVRPETGGTSVESELCSVEPEYTVANPQRGLV